MFNTNYFPDSFHFKYLKSDQLFRIERVTAPGKNRLNFNIYSGNDASPIIGRIIANCSAGDARRGIGGYVFMVLGMSVESDWRNYHLGALLLYLVAQECKINHASFLYLSSPDKSACGFYQQYGFFPAPEERQRLLSRTNPDFNHLYAMRLEYDRWRGAMDIIYPKMTENVNQYFAIV